MNTSYRLFIDFFIRQIQANWLQLDHLLGSWLQQPEAHDSPQHLCVLLNYAESLCWRPEQDLDGQRLGTILALYLLHEQRALSE